MFCNERQAIHNMEQQGMQGDSRYQQLVAIANRHQGMSGQPSGQPGQPQGMMSGPANQMQYPNNMPANVPTSMQGGGWHNVPPSPMQGNQQNMQGNQQMMASGTQQAMPPQGEHQMMPHPIMRGNQPGYPSNMPHMPPHSSQYNQQMMPQGQIPPNHPPNMAGGHVPPQSHPNMPPRQPMMGNQPYMPSNMMQHRSGGHGMMHPQQGASAGAPMMQQNNQMSGMPAQHNMSSQNSAMPSQMGYPQQAPQQTVTAGTNVPVGPPNNMYNQNNMSAAQTPYNQSMSSGYSQNQQMSGVMPTSNNMGPYYYSLFF